MYAFVHLDHLLSYYIHYFISSHIVFIYYSDVFLSILPCWHIFDRTCELYCLGRGASIVYSNLRSFKSDLVTRRPHVMIVVPRLLEMIQKGIISNLKQQIGIKKKLIELATKITNTFHYCSRIARNSNISNKRPNILKRFLFGFFALIIWPLYQVMDELVWSKVRAGLGGRLKGLISGGASLPMSTDRFFEMIGIHVINGYGMTETSAPIINRKVEHSVTGTVGSVMEDSQVKYIQKYDSCK